MIKSATLAEDGHHQVGGALSFKKTTMNSKQRATAVITIIALLAVISVWARDKDNDRIDTLAITAIVTILIVGVVAIVKHGKDQVS